jgi:uncharacterized protein (DUF1810 family)
LAAAKRYHGVLAREAESMPRLERFKLAQDSSHAGFASALEEIQTGGKRGHWIWYMFPQLSGLGASGFSHSFAIDGKDEAVEFLHDPQLRSRLVTITAAVATQLRTRKTTSLRALMGSDTDARKIVSSLTLFGGVAKDLYTVEGLDDYQTLAHVADEVLTIAASQGYPACEFTVQRLQESNSRLTRREP